jgi:hypothetical protein
MWRNVADIERVGGPLATAAFAAPGFNASP